MASRSQAWKTRNFTRRHMHAAQRLAGNWYPAAGKVETCSDRWTRNRRLAASLSVGCEPVESEPSSCFVPSRGPSRLSKRILIVWVEKGKRNFAKNSFFCWISCLDWQVADVFDRGRKPPTNQEAYLHYDIKSKKGKGRNRPDRKKGANSVPGVNNITAGFGVPHPAA